jgi:Glycosyl hydrolase family 26
MARIREVTTPPSIRVDNFRRLATERGHKFIVFIGATSLLLSIFSYSAVASATRLPVKLVQGANFTTYPPTFLQTAALSDSSNTLKSIPTTRTGGASPSLPPLTPIPVSRNGGSTSVITALKQGVYVGPADPTAVKTFATITNTKVSIASDFLPSREGWGGMDGDNGDIQWLTNAWNQSGYVLSLAIPIIPSNSQGQPLGNLVAGAAGTYNGYFKKLSQRLVAGGEGTAYLRLGWEFDGNWFPWQARSAAAEASFAAYFRQIVTAMRSVPGAAFRFVWNPDAAAFVQHDYSVSAAYPGNAYVNVIGLDIYDWNWGQPETTQSAWKHTFLPQLTAAEGFAQSLRKPLSFDEWAVVIPSHHGFGDDPYFINHMINWMNSPSNDVAYESYFNGDTTASGGSPDLDLKGGNFPQSLSAFEADLGKVKHY